MQAHTEIPAFEHFKNLSAELEAARVAWNARLSSLAEKIDTAAAEVAVAERNYPADPEKVAPFRAALRRLKQERAGLKAPSFVDPFSDLERFLKLNRPAVPVETVAEIRKNETPLAAFNRLYSATNTLIAAAGRIPPAVGADAEPWRKQIDAIAAAGAPRLGFGNTLELPKAATPAGLVLDNASALIAHLFKPQLIAAVEALQARKSSGPTMKPAERQEALRAAQDRIALALRMESAAATAAELAGQRVIRRKHVHPAILLNLECDAADVFEWLTKKRGGA